MWIDDEPVLNAWRDRGYKTDTFVVTLDEGYHNVRIDYYENGGSAKLSFSYTSPPLGCDSQCQLQSFSSGECVYGTQPQETEILFYTQKNANAIESNYESYAEYYDMIDNSYPWTPTYVGQMKTLNSKLNVIHYSSATGIYGTPDFDYTSSRGWLLKDSSGNYIIDSGWGAYYLDIGNSAVSHWLGQRLKDYIDEGYDGIFLDNCHPFLVGVEVAINPRTGQPYWSDTWPHTSDVFVNDMVKHIAILKTYLPNSLLIGNVITDSGVVSHSYYGLKEKSDKIINVLDGGMAEFWISDLNDWHGEDGWKAGIDLLQEMNSRGDFIFVPTDRNSASEQGAWYSFASFLIGVDDFEHTYLWSHSIDPTGYAVSKEIMSMDVGQPLGDYYKRSDGVYVREFSKVDVYVNPSDVVRGGMQPHTGRVIEKTTQSTSQASSSCTGTSIYNGECLPGECCCSGTPTETEPVTFVQFTDTHFGGGSYGGNLDSVSLTQNAIQLVKDKSRHGFDVDFVVVTGDLVGDPSDYAYQQAESTLDNLNPIPYYTLVGNHDYNFDMYLDYFSEHQTDPTSKRYVIDYPDVRVVTIAHNDGSPGGNPENPTITQDELNFLDSSLLTNKPSILAMHHLVTGTSSYQIANPEDVIDIMNNHPNSPLAISGHLHANQFIQDGDFYQSVMGGTGAAYGGTSGYVTFFTVYSDHIEIQYWRSSNANFYYNPERVDTRIVPFGTPSGDCTPGNDIIEETEYPSGSCSATSDLKWSHSNCGEESVCKQGNCVDVDADLTSYSTPSGKIARSDSLSIPYTIRNTGQTQWCFLTETELTKANGDNEWSTNYNSLSPGNSASDSLSYQVSCSDPLGPWSGKLYTTTGLYDNQAWDVWGPVNHNFQVVECLNNQDCVNCRGSGYTCENNVCSSGTQDSCYDECLSRPEGFSYGECVAETDTEDWVPSDAELWFSANFENTNFINPYDIDNNGRFSGESWDNVDYLVRRIHKMAIVTDPVNSNNKVLRVVYAGNTGSEHPNGLDEPNRPDVELYVDDSSEYWFSGWYYFPSSFQIYEWYLFGSDWGGWSGSNAATYGNGILGGVGFSVDGDRSVSIHSSYYSAPNWNNATYFITYTTIGILPLGRWFNVHWHLKLSSGSDGVVQVWFDESDINAEPTFEYYGQNKPPSYPSDASFSISVADHYMHVNGDIYGEQPQYTDNVKVWIKGDGSASTSTATCSGTSIGQDGCSSGICCCSGTSGQCTPGNDIIEETEYPSGQCSSSSTLKWSHSTCGNGVCYQGTCKDVDAYLTYTPPAGKIARSDSVSIPFTIENTGDISWCLLTEMALTKYDGSGEWRHRLNSLSTGSSASDSVSYQVECSDPLGQWSGSLYTTTGWYRNQAWDVWGPVNYNFQVVECLNNADCSNCRGSGYTCDTSSNTCKSGTPPDTSDILQNIADWDTNSIEDSEWWERNTMAATARLYLNHRVSEANDWLDQTTDAQGTEKYGAISNKKYPHPYMESNGASHDWDFVNTFIIRAYFQFRGTGKLTSAAENNMRNVLSNRAGTPSYEDPNFGYSENHEAMIVSAGYFGNMITGGSNSQNEAWLIDFLDDKLEHHYYEMNSPTYMGAEFRVLWNLYDFAASSTIRNKAKAVLDMLLAEHAMINIDGMRGGPFYRYYGVHVVDQSTDYAYRISQVYFDTSADYGGTRFINIFAWFSSYEVPQIIKDIANGNKQPFVLKSRRYSVPTYYYVTPHAVLATGQGDFPDSFFDSDYAQDSTGGRAHIWDILFDTSPRKVIFSGDEFKQYFYDEADAVQYKNVLITSRSETINYVGVTKVTESNWNFVQEGRTFVAVRNPLSNGRIIVEMRDADDYGRTFSEFKADIKDNSVSVSGDRVTYTNTFGETITSPTRYTIDGDSFSYKLFDSPYLVSNWGSGVITVKWGGSEYIIQR
ncbi:MAG: putative glycoside hydrolase [Candidatus Aenigmatarchaeota archaeon]